MRLVAFQAHGSTRVQLANHAYTVCASPCIPSVLSSFTSSRVEQRMKRVRVEVPGHEGWCGGTSRRAGASAHQTRRRGGGSITHSRLCHGSWSTRYTMEVVASSPNPNVRPCEPPPRVHLHSSLPRLASRGEYTSDTLDILFQVNLQIYD